MEERDDGQADRRTHAAEDHRTGGLDPVETKQEAGEVHATLDVSGVPRRGSIHITRSSLAPSRHLPVPRLRSMHAFRGSTRRAGSDMDRPLRMEMLRAGA